MKEKTIRTLYVAFTAGMLLTPWVSAAQSLSQTQSSVMRITGGGHSMSHHPAASSVGADLNAYLQANGHKPQAQAPLAPMQNREQRGSGVPQVVQVPDDGSGKVYASSNEWAIEPVSVRMIRNANFADAMSALMPPGWTIDFSGVSTDLSAFRIDLTTTNPRGSVVSELLREMNLSGFPYVEFNTFVVSSR